MPRGKKKKRSGSDSDGRVAVAITRGDCQAILKYVAGKMARLPRSTAQRLEAPLRSRSARYMAIRNARKEIALVYVDEQYESIVAATVPGSDREPLISVVRESATTFRERDMRNGSGPFAAANVRSAQLDVHKGPTGTRSAKVVRGGLPGLGRQK